MPDKSRLVKVSDEQMQRCMGAMAGLACGDALGTTLEFKPPGTFEPITDMVGGGPFNLAPGYWTDDTSMALCMAMSFIIKAGCDPAEQMRSYRRWRDEGYMSSTGKCFDIGNTVNAAIEQFRRTEDATTSGSTEEASSGNGGLMRLAPAIIFNLNDLDWARHDARWSTACTHGSQLCLQASDYFGVLLWLALQGRSKEEILDADVVADIIEVHKLRPEISDIVDGSYKNRNPPEIRGTGFVVESLEAALWAFYNNEDFESGALAAANLGDDADTTAAIFGQLAGATYGLENIPQRWRSRLFDPERIRMISDTLPQVARREFTIIG